MRPVDLEGFQEVPISMQARIELGNGVPPALSICKTFKGFGEAHRIKLEEWKSRLGSHRGRLTQFLLFQFNLEIQCNVCFSQWFQRFVDMRPEIACSLPSFWGYLSTDASEVGKQQSISERTLLGRSVRGASFLGIRPLREVWNLNFPPALFARRVVFFKGFAFSAMPEP